MLSSLKNWGESWEISCMRRCSDLLCKACSATFFVASLCVVGYVLLWYILQKIFFCWHILCLKRGSNGMLCYDYAYLILLLIFFNAYFCYCIYFLQLFWHGMSFVDVDTDVATSWFPKKFSLSLLYSRKSDNYVHVPCLMFYWMLEHFVVASEVFLYLCINIFGFSFFHMHVFRWSSGIICVSSHT